MASPNNAARMREVRAMARAIREDDKHLGPANETAPYGFAMMSRHGVN
jgi:hypothetical protein